MNTKEEKKSEEIKQVKQPTEKDLLKEKIQQPLPPGTPECAVEDIFLEALRKHED